MPIITGPITKDGAAIDLLIGPAEAKRQRSAPTPPIAIRGILDTGSAITGISRRLLLQLNLLRIDSKPIRNPIGPAQVAECYKLRLSFMSGGTLCEFADAVVIATDCFDEREEFQALIGRDVLDHCAFQYWGSAKTFQFAF